MGSEIYAFTTPQAPQLKAKENVLPKQVTALNSIIFPTKLGFFFCFCLKLNNDVCLGRKLSRTKPDTNRSEQ